MRLKVILHVLGILLCCVGATMLLPLGFAVYYGDASVKALCYAMGLTVSAGLLPALLWRKPARAGLLLNHREGMAIVTLGWLACGICGALPFMLSGYVPNFFDAFFESVSGFTTTGASILVDIEALPQGLLMWRALTHWLGGMGIILFSLAILPYLGVGGMQMYKAELSGPTADKLHPRLHDTAMTLWLVYGLFTLLLCILLLFGGMSFFDALAHTFATVATGGFSTRNTSVTGFSAYIQWVITIFMFLCSINFGLHYKMLRGSPKVYGNSAEFRWFALICLAATLLVTAGIYKSSYLGFEESLRHGAFQVLTIISTTGFATADYLAWGAMPQAVILLLFFVGGCAGSTAGGVKAVRVVVLFKTVYHELFRLVHPRTVRSVKLDGAPLQADLVTGIFAFFVIYLFSVVISGFLLTLCGVEPGAAFSGALSCLGNVGPGFGSLGPASNYAALPDAAKFILGLTMLLGRLEIFTALILLVPEFWRK